MKIDLDRNNDFDNAFKEVILNEGEFSDDKFDSGGATIYGITSRDYPDYYNSIVKLWKDGKKELAKDRVKVFYKKLFWNELYKDIPDPSLTFKLFDLSINRGTRTAVKLLQDTLFFDFGKTIVRDGVFGLATLTAIKMVVNQEVLYQKFIDRNEASYRKLSTFWRFGKGWLRRLSKRVYV